MNITEEQLWRVIEMYCPYARIAKMRLPEAIKQAIVEAYILDRNVPVLREAYKELHSVGWLTFKEE